MTNMGSMKITTTLLLLVVAQSIYAANDSVAHKNPQVVLVQISSERNRTEALEKDRKYTELEEVKRDAAALAATMKLDFQDHFNYCPVYYFIDTDLDRVKKKEFEGVLQNADGSVVKKPVINGKSYMIVYYGYPVADAGTDKPVTDSVKNHYNSGEPMGKGLVINNPKFQQVGYFYKFGYQDALFSKKADKKYVYHSKHFDIDYYPLAERFNKKLTNKK